MENYPDTRNWFKIIDQLIINDFVAKFSYFFSYRVLWLLSRQESFSNTDKILVKFKGKFRRDLW